MSHCTKYLYDTSLWVAFCPFSWSVLYLRRQHGADLGEQHMTWQSKQDVHSEGGKPHHPLKISRVLQIGEHRGKKKINNFFIPPDFKLKMLSYHFPPKVVPSWLHAGFKRLSVCIGWKLNKRVKYEEKKNTFSVIKYKIVLFCVVS